MTQMTHLPDAQGVSTTSRMSRLWIVATVIVIAVSALTGLQHAASTSESSHAVLPVLFKWAPYLLTGFAFNLLISASAMLIGTALGVFLGIFQNSLTWSVRLPARIVTQFFRNSPWLVLLFLCIFLLPIKLHVGGVTLPFPDWARAILGFSLPVMSNVAEMLRGALQSLPRGQTEAAAALGLSRTKMLFLVLLPQCIKPCLPPWMNLYAIVTMSSVNASVVGVNEMMTRISQVLAAEGGRDNLLLPLYGFSLLCFFLYCYPISRLTRRLEKRFRQRR